METEYTAGALTQAISGKSAKKKKKTAGAKNALADLFSTMPSVVNFVLCQTNTTERKKKKAEEAETLGPQKEEESKGKLPKRAKREAEEADSSEDEAPRPPRKKRMQPIPRDPKQEGRTVFVGNLPNTLKSKDVEKIFKPYGEVESVRFRSVAVADPEMPRKLAMIRRDFHPERNNMNAYVRFKNEEEAQAALTLNGHTYEGFCLRVDIAEKKQHDQNKSVFLGNLPFNIEENIIHSFFEDCGEIEGVRLIRDWRTGIGKGIGYIQFRKAEGVELALNLEGSQLGGRKLRVSRALNKPVLKKMMVKEKPKWPKQQYLRRKGEKSLPGVDRQTKVKTSKLRKNEKTPGADRKTKVKSSKLRKNEKTPGADRKTKVKSSKLRKNEKTPGADRKTKVKSSKLRKTEKTSGADRKTKVKISKLKKPVRQQGLKKKAAKRIVNGKKNKKITDGKINKAK